MTPLWVLIGHFQASVAPVVLEIAPGDLIGQVD